MFGKSLANNGVFSMFQRLVNSAHTSRIGVRWVAKMSDATGVVMDGVTGDVTAGLDTTQVQLLQEQCILVDNNDNKIGAASKKHCHLLRNINQGMLHRAFSVFLFNQQGELLLQQRSDKKITFPGHWTNTCCSHPLNTPGELETSCNIGVRCAAQRKLQHELGIRPEQVPVEGFKFLTRIHYRSDNVPQDGVWGEHEIDYILVAQRDVTIVPNDNEVSAHRYVNREQLKEIIDKSERGDVLITPWFRLVVEHFLEDWWENLNDLSLVTDENTIHRMVDS